MYFESKLASLSQSGLVSFESDFTFESVLRLGLFVFICAGLFDPSVLNLHSGGDAKLLIII